MRCIRPCALRFGVPAVGPSCSGSPVSVPTDDNLARERKADSVKSRYHSVRIDAVHYCQREYDLAAKRKRHSFFERNGEPKDAPQERLQHFSRTVRERPHLGVLVQYFKMPYMTRETCKSDLARTVSVLPNLRYVDLPEGFYNGDPSTMTLRQALQHRCPEIRKMKYLAGAEENFTVLGQTRQWQYLEILEISGLRVEPSTLLYVLGSFPTLHELTLANIPSLDDDAFSQNTVTPPFPALHTLVLENLPNISAQGLTMYLSRPDVRGNLTALTLANTGTSPETLHHFLRQAPYLTSLSISSTVTRSFPLIPIPPLSSKSLQSLHFEILSARSSTPTNPPSETYYSYLSTSLLSGALPSLTSLYALSPTLPLLLSPPTAPFANQSGPRSAPLTSQYPAQQSSFSQPGYPGHPSELSLYTKSAPELEWNLTVITPPSVSNDRRGSMTATRPVSLYNQSASLSDAWGGKNRDSTLVGNGFGGFLAVPAEGGGRPGSSSGKKGAKGEGWMG